MIGEDWRDCGDTGVDFLRYRRKRGTEDGCRHYKDTGAELVGYRGEGCSRDN